MQYNVTRVNADIAQYNTMQHNTTKSNGAQLQIRGKRTTENIELSAPVQSFVVSLKVIILFQLFLRLVGHRNIVTQLYNEHHLNWMCLYTITLCSLIFCYILIRLFVPKYPCHGVPFEMCDMLL